MVLRCCVFCHVQCQVNGHVACIISFNLAYCLTTFLKGIAYPSMAVFIIHKTDEHKEPKIL